MVFGCLYYRYDESDAQVASHVADALFAGDGVGAYVFQSAKVTLIGAVEDVLEREVEAAETELDSLETKWGEQYPIVIKSWRDNWGHLTEFFQYTKEIRRLIYTTNTVEGYHRQIRKVTKNKGVFPSDTALEKLVYLAYRNIREKWTMPLSNRGLISQQLAIKFGDRYEIM